MADKPAKSEGDLGQAEVQKTTDEAQEQGFIGTKVDPLPNSAHSLESGPDAPTILEQQANILDARTQDAKASSAGQGA